MDDAVRYAKTSKGIDEISRRQNNLTGKLRIMLILVDPSKTLEQLRMQGERIGAPADCLEAMVREGFIAPVEPVATGATTATRRANGVPVAKDEPARVISAKNFMKQTLAAGLGPAASILAARVERCMTRTELVQLLPEYEKSISRVSGDIEADLLADRLRRLLG
ncbi:MAG TPA: hypothetical protein VF814_04830 [Casimicrobiaceae bacterium]